MAKVTVGITAYNSEKYVEACLGSIVSQTMPRDDIEVILVDDGSTDETLALVNRYADQGWANFKVLTQPNSGGPSTGRNRIIDEAKGEFIFFVDIDDYLGPEALSKMWELSQVDSADVVLGRFVGVNGRGVPKHIFRETTPRTSIESTTLMDSMNVLKMFRSSYVRDLGLRFDPKIKIAEDHPFALAVYANTDRIAIQADVDCYFAVRHSTDAGQKLHLTGRTRTTEDFFAYMHASFASLATARAHQSDMANRAHGAYWKRLLTLDIPRRLKRTSSDKADLQQAKTLVDLYGANMAMPSLSSRNKFMLHALLNDDTKLVSKAVEIVLS